MGSLDSIFEQLQTASQDLMEALRKHDYSATAHGHGVRLSLHALDLPPGCLRWIWPWRGSSQDAGMLYLHDERKEARVDRRWVLECPRAEEETLGRVLRPVAQKYGVLLEYLRRGDDTNETAGLT